MQLRLLKPGSIWIYLEKDDNQAIVSVKDTGSGIDPSVETKLFMKFVTHFLVWNRAGFVYFQKA